MEVHMLQPSPKNLLSIYNYIQDLRTRLTQID